MLKLSSAGANVSTKILKRFQHSGGDPEKVLHPASKENRTVDAFAWNLDYADPFPRSRQTGSPFMVPIATSALAFAVAFAVGYNMPQKKDEEKVAGQGGR